MDRSSYSVTSCVHLTPLYELQIVAVTMSAGGVAQALAEELARRLGWERCFFVRWPGQPPPRRGSSEEEAPQVPVDPAYRKDANDVLQKDGAKALKRFISQAEPIPRTGLSAILLKKRPVFRPVPDLE